MKDLYLYAIRNKQTKKLINRKCGTGNEFYKKEYFAKNKMLEDGSEEIVKFILYEVLNN